MKPRSSAETPAPKSGAPRSLAELDAFLTLRLMRLEITTGSLSLAVLDEARTTGELVLRAGKSVGAWPPSDCDAELSETLRGVYAWIFGVLDALFLGECVRPLPKRLATELLDHGSVASMRSLLDPSLSPLQSTLIELTRACLRLARPR